MKTYISYGNEVPLAYRPFINSTFTSANLELGDLDSAQAVVVVGKSQEKALEGKKVFLVADFSQLLTGKVDIAQLVNGSPVDFTLKQGQQASSYESLAQRIANGYKPKLVAVTACPTGVAHTFMSAEALTEFAQDKGWNIKVETRGQQGVGNELTSQEVADADVVIAACDIEVDLTKFHGKKLYKTSTGKALKQTAKVFESAFTDAQDFVPTATLASAKSSSQEAKQEDSVYRHLMTGVSHMLPITVAGGLAIALSFLFGIHAFQNAGTLPAALMDIGGGSAFKIMLAVFSGYVAWSIADRPGLGVGLITGFMATVSGAGFLGAIITGFLSGYVVRYLNRLIKLPPAFQALKPILILPLLGSLIVGLFTYFVIGAYIPSIIDALKNLINSLQGGSSALVVGLVLGAMMCIDMGGPINKAAYVVSVGLLESQIYTPMATVMAAGMVPPIGMAIATWLSRRKFTPAQRDSGNVAFVLGLCFISEGAIPFAAADPLRVIVSSAIGGAITGAISMYLGITLPAPHGGIFVLFSVNYWLLYVVAIAVGSVITGVLYSLLKKAPQEA